MEKRHESGRLGASPEIMNKTRETSLTEQLTPIFYNLFFLITDVSTIASVSQVVGLWAPEMLTVEGWRRD